MSAGTFEFLVLRYTPPGEQAKSIGVFVWDSFEEQLLWWISPDAGVDEFDRRYLQDLSSDFVDKVAELGPKQLLHYLETTLSNVLLLTERQTIASSSAEHALSLLIKQYLN